MGSERSGAAVEAQIDEWIGAMTLEEKAGMCHAATNFRSGGVERLGIPRLCMSDGPHGVRQELSDTSWEPINCDDDAITYLPVGTALAATWNPDRARDFGDVLGAETRARGKDVILGPGINIVRTPLCGRNFEYYGEDPYHIQKLVTPAIQACQAHDVAACIKHYALNNQEWNRFHVDVEVDDRTLREIYLPGFETAIKEAGVLTVMGAYNLYFGQHCCHNQVLLNDILKDEWGFAYLVMSDWGGVHDADEAARCGLDIEMGGKLESLYLDTPFLEGLRDGTYLVELVDDKVRRILRTMFAIGLFDDDRAPGAMNTPAHQAVARRIADEALVLLKNEGGLLPLDAGAIKTLAVIGENADLAHAAGGGSSGLKALYEVTPLEGLRKFLGDDVAITHVKGYPCLPAGMEPIPTEHLLATDSAGIGSWRMDVFGNRKRTGGTVHEASVPAIDFACDETPCEGLTPGHWAITWRGTITPPLSGTYKLVLHGGDNYILKVDGKLLRALWDLTAPATTVEALEWEAGRQYAIEIELHPKQPGGSMQVGWVRPDADLTAGADPFAEAVAAAAEADAVLVFAGSTHMQDCEGQDRKTFTLHGGQDELIARVAAANPKTAVFLTGGAATALPWAEAVPAIVHTFYAGMEGGSAIAAMAFGETNPSGKLPFTWPVALEDVAAHRIGDYAAEKVVYKDAWRVGYRWTDGEGPKPRFCFGHGLSYTTFRVEGPTIHTGAAITEADRAGIHAMYGEVVAVVEATVSNTGDRAGAEVVQLYLGDEACSVERPVKELKGFAKVFLEPGASETVRLPLTKRDLSFYDVQTKAWIAEPGAFTVHIATSAEALHGAAPFDYAG